MYLTMYITLLSLVFYDTFIKSEDKIKKIIFVILNIILTIIASIRYYIGTDYKSYVNIFNGINNINDYSYLEIGFRVVILLIKQISNKSEVLFAFMAIISIAYFYKAIIKLSKKKLISIFIYFTIFYISYIFNALRQGFVMNLFLYSITLYEKENLVKILLVTLIGISFHSTGIIILICYILRNFEINKKFYPYILLIGIFICMFNPLQSILLNDNILGKYSYYDPINIVDIAQRALILIIFMINANKFQKIDKKAFNIYLFGWIFYCLMSFQSVVANRFNMLFRILEVILFSNLIYYTKDKFNKVIIYIFIILWGTSILIIDLQYSDNYPFKMIKIFSNL